MLLTTLGVASLVATAIFTAMAYSSSGDCRGQSRRSSIIEAWVNIAIGFTINYFVNLLVLPLIGAHPTHAQNFWMGCIFTGISVVRSYLIRRHFNNIIHNAATILAGEHKEPS